MKKARTEKRLAPVVCAFGLWGAVERGPCHDPPAPHKKGRRLEPEPSRHKAPARFTAADLSFVSKLGSWTRL